MCVVCRQHGSEISFREVPLKFLTKLQQIEQETFTEGEPVIRRSWYKESGVYSCGVTYHYDDGYGPAEDLIVFEVHP